VSSRGGSHSGRSELVVATADADPVTWLALGWLAAKPDLAGHRADQAPGDLVAAYLAGPAPGRGRLRRGH